MENNRQLLQHLNRITNNNAEETLPPGRKKKEVKVTVATIDNQPVIGLVNKGDDDRPWFTWEEQDPRNPKKNVLLCDLIVLDPKTKEKETIKRVNWIEFSDRGGRKECPIVNRKPKEWYIENGVTTRREVKSDKDFHMEETDEQVPDVVEGTEYEYVVDFNGTEISLHERFVNMVK